VTATRPPIPVRLAGRPAQGGLVVPWVQVRLADGAADFAARHRSKSDRCFREALCQLDGEPLGQPCVLLGGPAALEPGGYFDEPPLHPECARYTAAACPMVAGRMTHFRAAPTVSTGTRGRTCPKPGCDCGGWFSTDPPPRDEPRPAHPWFAVWVDNYALAVSPDGELLGAALTRPPLRVRPISATGGPA